MSRALLEENARLRARVAQLEARVAHLEAHPSSAPPPSPAPAAPAAAPSSSPPPSPSSPAAALPQSAHAHTLSSSSLLRYGRQLILPGFGVTCQERLSSASVLVVGAGGLGAPLCLYLAAAGLGRLGIVDPDQVGLDNLHRQIIHSEATIGTDKVESARDAVKALNSSVRVDTYAVAFKADNAMRLAREYDVIVDASDNVATRYLVNDVGILLGKPIVSGSALRFEGQCTVYGYQGGPCYRCFYPKPPPPETVTNCSDGGVLGVVPGLIGCVQAMEVLKIVAEIPGAKVMSERLLLFDAKQARFMSVKLRGRNPACELCGDEPTITELIDYELFCSLPANDNAPAPLLGKAENDGRVPSISPQQYLDDVYRSGAPHVLLDVRAPVQHEICSLPGSLNIPYAKLKKRIDEVHAAVEAAGGEAPVYVYCRRGIDSIRATKLLVEQDLHVFDVIGGIEEWNKSVDPAFPLY